MTDLFQEPDDATPLTPAEREGLRQACVGSCAEYFEAFCGEALGSMQQSWTAADVLVWLG